MCIQLLSTTCVGRFDHDPVDFTTTYVYMQKNTEVSMCFVKNYMTMARNGQNM
jgi:hypothetical protein